MEVFKLTLEARNPDRNCFRFWEIRVGPDLLDDWVMTTQWGRIGTMGQLKTFAVEGEKEAIQGTKNHLRRRLSSPKRIGIGYKVSFISDPKGWLKGDDILEKLEKDSCFKK